MFFRSHGFQATKLLRNYYEDSGEDAYQMEFRAPAFDPFEGVESTVNRIAITSKGKFVASSRLAESGKRLGKQRRAANAVK